MLSGLVDTKGFTCEDSWATPGPCCCDTNKPLMHWSAAASGLPAQRAVSSQSSGQLFPVMGSYWRKLHYASR
uniref:Uncharacterized protein n=1 Tax=Anguilla anguilla TaxID=7936 RepID=A0A0E9RL34_ANGAN